MELADLLRFTVDALTARNTPYMIVGSVASMAYGEPRLTLDIDVVVDVGESEVSSLCEAFSADEFYVSRSAAQQAVKQGGQFNVIHPASGGKIDFIVARRDDWGRERLARRRLLEVLSGCSAYVASPEDVILGKLWYHHEGGSEKHLRDIAGILRVQGAAIDRQYIERWAGQLGYITGWRLARQRADGEPPALGLASPN